MTRTRVYGFWVGPKRSCDKYVIMVIEGRVINLGQMLLDGVHDDRGVVEVFLGQDGQHVDERLAVDVQIRQAGQILGLDFPGPFVHGSLVKGGRCHDCTLRDASSDETHFKTATCV